MDGTAAPHRSAGTDGPGPGGGGGGDGWVGGWVVAWEQGVMCGRVATGRNDLFPETKRRLYEKGPLYNDITYRTCKRNTYHYQLINIKCHGDQGCRFVKMVGGARS